MNTHNITPVILIDPEKDLKQRTAVVGDVEAFIAHWLGFDNEPFDPLGEARVVEYSHLGGGAYYASEGADIEDDIPTGRHWIHGPTGARFAERGVIIGVPIGPAADALLAEIHFLEAPRLRSA